jgi:CheY-like chemotaxis protein
VLALCYGSNKVMSTSAQMAGVAPRAAGEATVLVADDDSNDVFFVRRAFEKAGFTFSIKDVSDGELVIEYLRGAEPYSDRSLHPVPALMLLDLKMPKVNGFEVLEWLQAQQGFEAMKVVVLSSSGLPADVEKAKRLGAHDYRVKPADVSEMLGLVQELAARWLPVGSGTRA